MSHLKERKEKLCLNCKTNLFGRFCHVCGQENLEPKETVWHLITHFLNDITHFDGKFFSTVKYLLFRPGFLSTEYRAGRRASYLNPIRMYVFTSAFFFLIFFSLKDSQSIVKIKDTPTPALSEGLKDWEKQKKALETDLKNLAYSDEREDLRAQLDMINLEIATAKRLYGDTTTRKFNAKEKALLLAHAFTDSLQNIHSSKINGRLLKKITPYGDFSATGDTSNNAFGLKYRTHAEYDSAQKALPEERKDGWLKKILIRKLTYINEELKKNRESYIEHFKEGFLHSFPKILFLSLPFFALILKLVYVRRKQFYYVDHGIFTIHLYCATFILMLLEMLFIQLIDVISWQWLRIIFYIFNAGIIIYLLIYLYMAMRGFYKQGRGKTFLKYLLICTLSLIVNIFLLVLFFLITAVSV